MRTRPLVLLSAAAVALAACSGADRGAGKSAAADTVAIDRRDCRVPDGAAGTALEHATRCAELYVARNGYTELPPVPDSTQWVAEFMDSPPWSRVMAYRHGKLVRRAVLACGEFEGAPGYLVGFRLTHPHFSPSVGRGLLMDSAFHDMHLVHQDLYIEGMRKQPHCVDLEHAVAERRR